MTFDIYHPQSQSQSQSQFATKMPGAATRYSSHNSLILLYFYIRSNRLPVALQL